MYDIENSLGLDSDDSDLLDNGLDNVDLEIESSDLSQDESEENEGNESSESDLEEERESDPIDYSSILLSIDGRLENVELSLANIETNQLDIVDNSETTATIMHDVIPVSIILAFCIVLFTAMYKWLDNMIK